MAGLSRKDLKHDKFVEEVGHSVQFFEKHKTAVIGGAAAVVAVIVGVSSWMGYQRSQTSEANNALQEAIRAYHGVVTTEQASGRVTYATSGERVRRTTEALEQVKTEFPGSDVAGAADYYLALLDIEEKKTEEARARLERIVGEKRGGEYYGLARLTLAEMLAREGKVEEARAEFQGLVDNPSPVVPAERAKLEMARFLAKHDPDAARTILEELVAQQGPASAAASMTLSQLGQGS